MRTSFGFLSSTDRRPQRVILLTGAAALFLMLSSCAGKSGRKPVYPVRGQVFVGDKPAVQAFVVFHPADDEGPQATRPYGHVGTDGSFFLTTYDPGDGAPAGEYLVTIVWAPVVGTEEPHDRLKGRYRDPKTSELRATVQEGPNELSRVAEVF
jgi:hypothetical protein